MSLRSSIVFAATAVVAFILFPNVIFGVFVALALANLAWVVWARESWWRRYRSHPQATVEPPEKPAEESEFKPCLRKLPEDDIAGGEEIDF